MGLLNRVAARAVPGPVEGEAVPSPSGIPETVWEEIHRYYQGNSFRGIIFERPDEFRAESSFDARLAHICAFFGVVVSLPPRWSLILFPRSMDYELLVHRLSNSLNITPLTVFEADNPHQAAERLLKFF